MGLANENKARNNVYLSTENTEERTKNKVIQPKTASRVVITNGSGINKHSTVRLSRQIEAPSDDPSYLLKRTVNLLRGEKKASSLLPKAAADGSTKLK